MDEGNGETRGYDVELYTDSPRFQIQKQGLLLYKGRSTLLGSNRSQVVLIFYLALLNLELCYSIPSRQPITIGATCVIRIIIDRHIFSTPSSKKRCGENGRDLFFGTVMSAENNRLTSHSTATDLRCGFGW